jgi:hypothetical protein
MLVAAAMSLACICSKQVAKARVSGIDRNCVTACDRIQTSLC